MTAFLALHVSVVVHYVVRSGSRDWWRHLVVPVIGFAILLLRGDQRERRRPGARLRLARRSAWWCSSACRAKRRRPSGCPRSRAGRRPARRPASQGGRSRERDRRPPLPPRGRRAAPTRSAAGSRCARVTARHSRSSCTPRTASAALVRGVDDLPSLVCEFPYLNPVTGPFHVEGAEPGDTLARALRRRSPRPATGRSPRPSRTSAR